MLCDFVIQDVSKIHCTPHGPVLFTHTAKNVYASVVFWTIYLILGWKYKDVIMRKARNFVTVLAHSAMCFSLRFIAHAEQFQAWYELMCHTDACFGSVARLNYCILHGTFINFGPR